MRHLLDTRRPRLLLTLFCLLLWTPGFFTLPPGDRDESRFVQASKQMIETGDYVRIQNGAEARNRKPIGIHWLQVPFAAAARGLGLATENPVWPYRIPSALGGLCAVLGTFWAGQRLVGQRAALLASGMLAASVILVVEAHIAKTDAALLGATTAAMALLARAYLDPGGVRPGAAALFWLAIGAGVLLKGPVTPMVAGLTVLALVVADRRAAWLRALRPGWGMPLMLAVVLPWFVAIGVATGGGFFADAVGGDLGRKLASGDDSHWGPPGLHLLLLPVLLFPLSGLLPGAVLTAWRGRRTAPARFLAAWVVPSWIVFEAVPTKLPHYTLPLYPALCLLAASWALQPGREVLPRWGRLLAVALPCLGALVLAVGALGGPVTLGMPVWLGLPAAAAGLAGWLAVRAVPSTVLPPLPPGDGWGEGSPTAPTLSPVQTGPYSATSGPVGLPHPNPLPEGEGAIAALAAGVVLYAAILGFELPRLAPLWIAPRVVAALPERGGLGAVGFSEPSLMFLAGTDTQWLLAADAAAVLASGHIRTLLVGDRDRAAVLAGAERDGVRLREIAEVPGFNYSRGRRVALTIYRLAP
ncbi:MAG TPA: glycosyltransferase family 39 protein [Acetobacteraceae bacterium]